MWLGRLIFFASFFVVYVGPKPFLLTCGKILQCSPYHKGLTDALLTQITSAGGNPTAAQQKKAEEDSSEVVKAALIISGADRCRYGVLKDALANNYLLVNDQYPDTYDKAFRVLANYQVTKTGVPYRASPDNTGVAFLQRGGRGGQGGRGGRGGQGDKKDGDNSKEGTMT